MPGAEHPLAGQRDDLGKITVTRWDAEANKRVPEDDLSIAWLVVLSAPEGLLNSTDRKRWVADNIEDLRWSRDEEGRWSADVIDLEVDVHESDDPFVTGDSNSPRGISGYTLNGDTGAHERSDDVERTWFDWVVSRAHGCRGGMDLADGAIEHDEESRPCPDVLTGTVPLPPRRGRLPVMMRLVEQAIDAAKSADVIAVPKNLDEPLVPKEGDGREFLDAVSDEGDVFEDDGALWREEETVLPYDDLPLDMLDGPPPGDDYPGTGREDEHRGAVDAPVRETDESGRVFYPTEGDRLGISWDTWPSFGDAGRRWIQARLGLLYRDDPLGAPRDIGVYIGLAEIGIRPLSDDELIRFSAHIPADLRRHYHSLVDKSGMEVLVFAPEPGKKIVAADHKGEAILDARLVRRIGISIERAIKAEEKELAKPLALGL